VTDTYNRFRNEVMAGGASESGAPDPPSSRVQGFVGLGLIVALLALLAWYSGWAFAFVVLLLVCVCLHEVGHFVTARMTGMKATQFFLFMGPRLFSFRRGETEYGIRAYPLGAFVRIIGMNNLDEVDPADEPRAYRNQSYPRRMLVITAGSMMHVLIAIALLFGVYATTGRPAASHEITIGTVVDGSAADQAGLQPDDVVHAVSGARVTSEREFQQALQSHAPGDAVTLQVERDGRTFDLVAVLGANPAQGPSFGKPFLGVGYGELDEFAPISVAAAAGHSVTDLGAAMWDSVGGVVKVLNPVNIVQHVTGANDDPTTQPTTVVGLGRASKSFGADGGLANILLVLAGVNVFIGLFNLFPILSFDGGHAAIATYERVRSRRGRAPYRADVSKMMPVAMGMMTLLAFLMVAGLYLDFAKPIR
jgi:membrane-associated protease RseP (regulator of RpoE activity)